MARTPAIVRNCPSFLTPYQRSFLDKLIERVGIRKWNCHRNEIRKAGRELMGWDTPPSWIVRNFPIKKDRGIYDVDALTRLPVHEIIPGVKRRPRLRGHPMPSKKKKTKNVEIQIDENPVPPESGISVLDALKRLGK